MANNQTCYNIDDFFENFEISTQKSMNIKISKN
jgi:hypothetical protein